MGGKGVKAMNAISIVAATVAGAVDTRVFHVLLANMSRVEIALQSLAKRAARKGLPVLAWSWGKAYSERTQVPHAEYGWQGACVRGRLICTPHAAQRCPQIRGWTFVAALQHLDGENIVRAVPAKPSREAFRFARPMCDHCKQLRRRNDTYVLRHDDGRIVQVGSTCIGDFLGSDDGGEARRSSVDDCGRASIAEGGCSGSGAASSDRLMGDFLSFVSFCVRSHGWKSRTIAREQGGQATADSAWGFLIDAKLCAKYDVEPTAEDKEAAQAAEVWPSRSAMRRSMRRKATTCITCELSHVRGWSTIARPVSPGASSSSTKGRSAVSVSVQRRRSPLE